MTSVRYMQYSIVIPCYRSSPWLEELVDRVVAALEPDGAPFEILLVNDASPDETWEAIERLAGRHRCVRGFDMLANVGQFRATICGLEHARGEFVVTLDDDLQHAPEDIPRLIEALRARPDLDCIVARMRTKCHGPLRRLGSAAVGRLNELLYGKPRDLKLTSFRTMRRHVAKAVCAHRTSKPIIGPLLLRSTSRIANVVIDHHPRQRGTSGYSLPRLVRIALDNLFSASTLPLRCVSLVGLVSAAGSALVGGFNLARYLMGDVGVPGFATLVLLIAFFGGTTLLSIGLLGEYVIRIVHEVERPPRYVVRTATGSGRRAPLRVAAKRVS